MKGIHEALRGRTVLALLFLAACVAAGVMVGRHLGGPGEAPPGPTYHVTETAAPHEAGLITIYTMSTCAASQEAKDWLAKEGLVHTEKIVDRSEQALSEVKRLGAHRTPLLLIGRYQMEGFDPAAAKQLVADAQAPAPDDT